MTVPEDCPPPPPRLKSSRVEALRAAAKVHEGPRSGVLAADDVLDTADVFEAWLLEQDPDAAR